jgi:GT2 family glycosyltransferase
VVDNGSTDGSIQMLMDKFSDLNLISNPVNRGFAAANNQALAHALGRHVLLLNTDTLVHGSVLPDAARWLDDNPQVAVLGPRILNRDGSVQGSATAFPSLYRLARQTLGLHKHEAPNQGQTHQHRAEVFYGEETDWCRRFDRAGWGVVYAPLGEITHFGGGSVRRLNHRRDLMLTEGTVRLHAKHFGPMGALACFALLALFNISRAMGWAGLALVRRPQAAERARHFLGVVVGLATAWPKGRSA